LCSNIKLIKNFSFSLCDKIFIALRLEYICKVNFATELRQAYTAGVCEYIEGDPQVFDPKKYGKTAMAKVCEAVAARIKVCGADGKAD
jgi:tagatose 1,6-diphosphate aldolase GatY/KbaY